MAFREITVILWVQAGGAASTSVWELRHPFRSKMSWRMPPLAFLARPAWSRGRLIGMYALRGYLLVAVCCSR
jgi:hypothetical protein